MAQCRFHPQPHSTRTIFVPQWFPHHWGWNRRELPFWWRRYRKFCCMRNMCGLQRRFCIRLIPYLRRLRRLFYRQRFPPPTHPQRLHNVVQHVFAGVVWQRYHGRLHPMSAKNWMTSYKLWSTYSHKINAVLIVIHLLRRNTSSPGTCPLCAAPSTTASHLAHLCVVHLLLSPPFSLSCFLF